MEGTDLLVPSVALPSILGGLIAFSLVIGPAYTLAMEREDGTLLRPQGDPARVCAPISPARSCVSLGQVPQLIVIFVPSFLLFDNLMAGGARDG